MNIEKMIGVYVEYCRSEMLRPKTIEAYKVILEIAKMILEIGVDGTDEDFDRLLGYIAEAESHARCSWVDCETNADDLAEYYDLVLRVNRGDIFG